MILDVIVSGHHGLFVHADDLLVAHDVEDLVSSQYTLAEAQGPRR